MEAATERGMAEVNGTCLYYEARGSGQPLLFLHGFALDHRMWRRQVEAFATSHRVVAYDARGFGRSRLPTTEAYRHLDDAAALCERLGLTRVIAVGHSVGAHHMLELALARPDLVVGLVSLCMSGLGSVPLTPEVTKRIGATLRSALTDGVDAAKSMFSRDPWWAPAREDRALGRELDAMLADYSGWHWTHANNVRALAPPAAERLHEVQIPVLVVTGGRDLAYNGLIADELTRGIPGATSFHVAPAGHMANMEEPAAVNRAVAAFLKTI